jgi:hypothetical protein
MAMDETRTLSILGWIIGGVVGVVFVLNAIALALILEPRQAGVQF